MAPRKPYNQYTDQYLRKMCIQRKIDACLEKGKITKKELVSLLEKDDKKIAVKQPPAVQRARPVINIQRPVEPQPVEPRPVINVQRPDTSYPPPSNAEFNSLILSRLANLGGGGYGVSPPVSIDFQSTSSPPVKKTKKTYKKDSEFTLSVKDFQPKDEEEEKSPSITLRQFRKEIDNDKFIDRFLISTKKLLEYKYNFYMEKYKTTQEEHIRTKEKVTKFKNQGASEDTIKQLFPMKDLYIGFTIQLKEIMKNIKDRLDKLDKDYLRKNLIDALENEKKGFASIVGRKKLKNSIVSQLYAFSQNYRVFTNSFNNIALLGGAGVGKTSTAIVMSYVYSKCGILVTNNTKIVSRADLIGQYIGETAPKTRGILMETLEGVLLIDEAYQLAPPSLNDNKDFGPEAITEIVNFLDKYIGMNIVIVAGYPTEMLTRFFPTNEGLSRRFPYQLILPNYSNEELTDILVRFIESKLNKLIDDETSNYLYNCVVFLSKLPLKEYGFIFKNQAGDMLNLGTSIVKSINSAYSVKWKDGNLKNNILILREGFNDFLKLRAIQLE